MASLQWCIAQGTYALNGYWYIVTLTNVQRVSIADGRTVFLYGLGCTLSIAEQMIAEIELCALARTIVKQ